MNEVPAKGGRGPRSAASRPLGGYQSKGRVLKARKAEGRGNTARRGRVGENDRDHSDSGGEPDKDTGANGGRGRGRYHHMACPFYKLDPNRYYRCGGKYELKTYDTVKQHIIRIHRHKEPHYCPTCWALFENINEQETHVRARRCGSMPKPDEFTHAEIDDLTDGMPSGLDGPGKWRWMWRRFFPAHPMPDSIFVEDGIQEPATLIRRAHRARMLAVPRLQRICQQTATSPEVFVDEIMDSIYAPPLIPGSPRLRDPYPQAREPAAFEEHESAQDVTSGPMAGQYSGENNTQGVNPAPLGDIRSFLGQPNGPGPMQVPQFDFGGFGEMSTSMEANLTFDQQPQLAHEGRVSAYDPFLGSEVQMSDLPPNNGSNDFGGHLEDDETGLSMPVTDPRIRLTSPSHELTDDSDAGLDKFG